jgi:hypothetical protein
VSEAHQLDEVEERLRRVLEAHAAPSLPRGELQPRERVDADRVGLDAADVTAHEPTVRREDRANALAEAGEVGAGERAADPESDLVRPLECHRRKDGARTRNSAELTNSNMCK